MTPPIEGGEYTEENVTAKLKNGTREEKNIIFKKLQQEIKEELEKLPELDKENFRVEDTEDRITTTDAGGLAVLENLEGDIREYLEGDHKGQQFFTKLSIIRETKKAGKKLPASGGVYRDIIEKEYNSDYQKFKEGEKMKATGFRSALTLKFSLIDEDFVMRYEDGSFFHGEKGTFFISDGDGFDAYSARCLKN